MSGFYKVQERGVKSINDYSTKMKQRQDWSVGAIVNVGFLKNLTVNAKNKDGSFALTSAKGKSYTFEAHRGLFAND